MKRYDAVTHYLKNSGGSQVTSTFTQSDKLLSPSNGLPKTTRESAGWQANDYKHPEKGVHDWINTGYEVVVINLDKEYVVFGKLMKFSWLLD